MAHDVFISYSGQDKTVADAVCAALESRRIRCWIAPRDVAPGSEWAGAIMDSIAGGKAMVVIFSNHANNSRHVMREVERAVSEGLAVLPFRLEDVPFSRALSYFLGSSHWLDALTPPLEARIAELVEAVSRLLTVEASPGSAPAFEKAPHRALQIDDVIVSKGHRHISLDVRLRNAGSETLNITRADLHILRRWPYAAAYQPSATYDLLLEGDHNVLAVAHVVLPNEVDRLVIRVGFTPFNTSCGFEAELIVHFNNGLRAISRPFAFESSFASARPRTHLQGRER